MTPDFDWSRYFGGIGLPEIGKVNVGQTGFFKAADKLLISTPLDDGRHICGGFVNACFQHALLKVRAGELQLQTAVHAWYY